MNALAFIFRPLWVAAVNFAHLLALLLAAGGAWAAPPGRRRLGAIMLLAALGWAVGVAVSLRVATLPVGTAPAALLAVAPLAAALPVWVAALLCLLRPRRG